jgi:transcription initiation factor TFIID subunit TAF12
VSQSRRQSETEEPVEECRRCHQGTGGALQLDSAEIMVNNNVEKGARQPATEGEQAAHQGRCSWEELPCPFVHKARRKPTGWLAGAGWGQPSPAVGR